MKTINNRVKKALFVVFCASSLVAFTACDDSSKSKNRNSSPYYRYDQNGLRQRDCASCAYSNVVADAVGVIESSISPLEIGLSIYSDSSYGANDYYGGYNNYGGSFSSGQIEAEGIMTVFKDDSYYCPLPRGEYRVYTVSPGYLNGFQWASNLELVAEHMSSSVNVRIIFQGSMVNFLDRYSVYLGADGFDYKLGLNGFMYMEIDAPSVNCVVGGISSHYVGSPQ